MQGQWMRMTIASIAFIFVSAAARAQLPPAAELLPPGFKVVEERKMTGIVSIRAERPDEKSAKGDTVEGVKLEIGWQRQPMVDRIFEMMANQPEAKASENPMSGREEPCGKQRYRGGVLTCRKLITPWIGTGNAPDKVTLRLMWQGKDPEGFITITIGNFSGPKETAMGWMDTMIPKVTKAKH